jgi:FkbM family methyltransferase
MSSSRVRLHKDFNGYTVDGIDATNDGDVANYFVCKELLQRTCGGVCVDVGADQGAWTAMIHAIDSCRFVYGFEPNPSSYVTLGRNLKAKEHRRMHLFRTAISDISGSVILSEAGAQSAIIAEGDGIEVDCRPLTNFVQPHEFICVAKIDTEGHDLHVLKSMYPLLEDDCVGSILTEWSPHLYGRTKAECYANSSEVMEKVADYLPWVYALSRSGPPFLVDLGTAETRDEFLQDHLTRNFQTDLLFTRQRIESLPVVEFEVDMWYA